LHFLIDFLQIIRFTSGQWIQKPDGVSMSKPLRSLFLTRTLCLSALAVSVCAARAASFVTLWDVDFGAVSVTSKSGPAAVGQGVSDFWNYYTRSDGHGGFRPSGALANMPAADGSVTPVGMAVNNAAGAWHNGSPDPMYYEYLYPISSGNLTVTITNLPAGTYDVLTYAGDGNFELSIGGTSYGIKQSFDPSPGNPPAWTEGVQYAKYGAVQVNAGQAVVLTVRPGVYGYATISGMQLGLTSGTSPTQPFISTQPASQTVVSGGTASFTVAAGGAQPLSYQWRRNGGAIDGASSSLLTLVNVQTSQAGTYTVLVTNTYGSILSSNALLSVTSPSPLWDIDFGAVTVTSKAGPAAIGQTGTDFWNYYTRSDGQGGFRPSGTLVNMPSAGGASTPVGMVVANAAGAWHDGSPDPMYYEYLYPLGSGNLTVTVTNLPVAQYSVLLYAADGNYELSVGTTSYGVKQCYDPSPASSPVWTEGVQYVRYDFAQVASGQSLIVTVRPGVTGYATIAGMQISRTGELNHPPIAANAAAATTRNQPITIAKQKLLLYASDPDHDPLTLSIGGSSTNSGSVTLGGDTVTYTPPHDFLGADRFTYSVSDGRGGAASAFVLIQVRPGDGGSGNMLPLAPITGGYRVSFMGLPGRTYTLQRGPAVTGPWTTLATVTTDANGLGIYTDTSAPPDTAYYRTTYP
jgi:hypothetical protein